MLKSVVGLVLSTGYSFNRDAGREVEGGRPPALTATRHAEL